MRPRTARRTVALTVLVAGLVAPAARATTTGTLRLLNPVEPVSRVIVPAATPAELVGVVETKARCLTCRAIARADGLAPDCDALDDGSANGSCS